MTWLALDIGGANLKLSDGNGFALSEAFALWRAPQRLSQELRTIIAQAPPSSHLAVTMTGELADCFASRAEGVEFILGAVNDSADGRHTRVYRTDGKFVTPQAASVKPQLVAAANWHALARYAGRFQPQGASLLIDIGSTTCDLIPLADGEPAAAGKDDTGRLISGELVYTGVERSPVCAIADSTIYRGRQISVAQEVFATMRDVYLIVKDIPEEPTQTNTADGRPATKAAARTRLGRMILADAEHFNHRDAVTMAQSVADAQLHLLAAAVQRVIRDMPSPPARIVLSGQGEFLSRRIVAHLGIEEPIVSFTKRWGHLVARCGCAHALAVLAREVGEAGA